MSTRHELILVADDEPRMTRFIRMNLELEGYRVIEAHNGMQALDKARTDLPDLVILDVMMPEMDGFETLEMLREVSNVPVIMLTVRSDEEDKVRGLELGADDYITKPFGTRELVSRVKAVLRRVEAKSGTRKPDSPLVVGDLEIDPQAHTATCAGVPLDLSPREFDLLTALASSPEKVVSTEQLLSQVWGAEYIGQPQVVYVHMRWLRQKLEADPDHPRRILTVRGVGYKLVPQESH